MALKIDMCRMMVDVKTGAPVAHLQVGLVDENDKDLRKARSISFTMTPALIQAIKPEVNTALAAEGFPTIP